MAGVDLYLYSSGMAQFEPVKRGGDHSMNSNETIWTNICRQERPSGATPRPLRRKAHAGQHIALVDDRDTRSLYKAPDRGTGQLGAKTRLSRLKVDRRDMPGAQLLNFHVSDYSCAVQAPRPIA